MVYIWKILWSGIQLGSSKSLSKHEPHKMSFGEFLSLTDLPHRKDMQASDLPSYYGVVGWWWLWKHPWIRKVFQYKKKKTLLWCTDKNSSLKNNGCSLKQDFNYGQSAKSEVIFVCCYSNTVKNLARQKWFWTGHLMKSFLIYQRVSLCGKFQQGRFMDIFRFQILTKVENSFLE